MPAAARRYAKALLSLAQEAGQEEAIGAELTHIASVLAEPSLAQTLALPTLSPKTRSDIVESLIGAATPHALVANFLRVLAVNDRLSVVADIESAYQSLLEKLLGRVRARVKSASDLSEDELKTIVDAFSQKTKKTVIPIVELEHELLGGVTVEIEGQVYDASLKTQLRRVSQALAQRL
jgi:F-type H+-transporting ATPase subunit delta